MSLIKRSLSDRAVSPDLPSITRFLNDELKPLVRDLRARINKSLLTTCELPAYATVDLPTLTTDVRAIAWDTTLGVPVKWDGSSWTAV